MASDSCQGISVLVFWKRLLVEEFSSFFLSVAVCACSDGRRRPLTHVSRFLFSVFVPPPPSSFFSCHQSVCKKKTNRTWCTYNIVWIEFEFELIHAKWDDWDKINKMNGFDLRFSSYLSARMWKVNNHTKNKHSTH